MSKSDLHIQDKSWRVRYMVANQLYDLCEAVGQEATRYWCSVINQDASTNLMVPKSL